MQLGDRVELLDPVAQKPVSQGIISGKAYCDPPKYDVTKDDGEILTNLSDNQMRPA